jgi:hypothetical protein
MAANAARKACRLHDISVCKACRLHLQSITFDLFFPLEFFLCFSIISEKKSIIMKIVA